MKRKMASKSGLFLLEMMISILFFSIAAAVCARVFVKAHLLSRDAVNLNMASAAASNAAELFAQGKEKEDLQEELPGAAVDESGNLCVYYDGEWNLCSSREAEFEMKVAVAETGKMQSADIRVKDMQGEELFALSVKNHIPYRAGEKVAADE